MSRTETLRRILSAQLGQSYPPDFFRPETPLLGTIPELDSMAVVGILTSLEEELDVHVSDDAVSADVFGTFGTLSDFVEELGNA